MFLIFFNTKVDFTVLAFCVQYYYYYNLAHIFQANEIHFICGKKCCRTNDIKMRQAIWNKNQTMPSWQEQAREKGAQ